MEGPPPVPERPRGERPEGTPPDPTGPEAPPVPAAPPAERGPAGYRGPVPPGGWEQPLTRPLPPWAGAPLAGWWSRVGATILDSLILTVPVAALVLLVIAVAAGSEWAAVVVGLVALLAYFLAALFYAPLLMARDGRSNGQTWGKQIVGIRVVRDTGEPVSLGFGFLRELVVKAFVFGFLGGFLLSIPTLLDWLWPLWDDENRCLHDMLVKTHVVRT
jgi:uncharacterized RDD family membrane protein YckC